MTVGSTTDGRRAAITPRSRAVRILRGPSVWRAAPVALLEVELGAPALAPSEVERLAARLVDAIPSLDGGDHAELAARIGERPAPALAALLRVATELQRLAGGGIQGGAVLPNGGDGTWMVALEYEEESAGAASLRFAAEVVELCLKDEQPEVGAMVAGLRRRLRRDRPDADTAALIAAARARDIPVRREAGEPVVQLGTGCHRRAIDGARTDATSATGFASVSDPVSLRRALDRFEIPMPPNAIADSLDEALDEALDLGYPVVLKAADGEGAIVTSPRLDDAAALRAAHRELRTPRMTTVVERFVDAVEHRLLFVDGKLVDVSRSGDGEAPGVDRVHPEIAALLGFVTDALGLGVAGVTLRGGDVGVPFRESDCVVVGLSARPRLARFGAAPTAIVDALFPPGSPSRVPIVAVTGTNGKTTTSRLIAHLLGASGLRVGFTTTDGVYVDGKLVFEGDMTGPMAADIVLANPRVDAAVLETARGGILRAGIGFDVCDVAVVLNVSADHIGIDGIHSVEQLAVVKGVLPTLVRPEGFAVLNADDAHVRAMRTSGTVALFAVSGRAAVAEHVDAGGRALTVEDGEFVLYRAGTREAVMPVADAPLTIGGAAHFQVANAAAALLAAACVGVELGALRTGLRGFASSAEATPGRMNLLRYNGGTIVVDYAHNEAAVAALFEFGARMNAARRIAVIGAPGDRRDEDIRRLGALAVGLDFSIFRESTNYLRGRAPGAIAALLADGFASAGGEPARMAVVPDEDEAIADALRRMCENDLLLLMAAEPARALEALRAAGAEG